MVFFISIGTITYYFLSDIAIKTVKDGEDVIHCVVEEDTKVLQGRLWNDVNVNTTGVVMSSVKNVPKHCT